MSGSFTGFSEDDIRKLTTTNPNKVKVNAGISNNTTSNKTKPVLNQQKRVSNIHQSSDEVRSKILNEKIINSHSEPIIESAKLSKAPQLLEETVQVDNNPMQDLEIKISSAPEVKIPDDGPSKEPETSNDSKEAVLVERKLNLNEFQAKQKLIEEQNRQRKELLIKALAVKTKQTQEETQRLNEIRAEFKKLDALLSNDVKFLRKQIEVASLDYLDAEKRYFRVEKEFLESKLALHQKLERKEMLTEHLCTIIEKNEERKAEKLNELLLKLNLHHDLETEKSSNDVKLNDGGTNINSKSDNNLETN